jgi:hypothetical protein
MSTIGLNAPSRYLLGAGDSKRARLLLKGQIHRGHASTTSPPSSPSTSRCPAPS